MKRISLLLVVGVVMLVASVPANAQAGTENRCIPTSDTPIQFGAGPLPIFTSVVLYGSVGGVLQIFASTDVVNNDGTVTFAAGLAPAVYGIGLIDRFGNLTPLGTIQIGDCPLPVPTALEQCKNGGWTRFDFTNQGRCIAFVNRGAMPSVAS